MASDEKFRSKKRPAEGDPDGEQPLTKRFGCLRLDHDSRARTTYETSFHEPDPMLLDDTKHTTYIHDLDQELADSELPQGTLVLSPLAAKMIKVPDSVLASNPAQGKELVLYTEPASLTLPKEKDSVRKAIIESRARARAARSALNPADNVNRILVPTEQAQEYAHEPELDDPMDIDMDL
ncbi:hypothetical protein N7528_002748 [Penicillium herquei]|nr:hypothetical protein N7528_002748 [Penicillium herquei]